MWQVRRQIREQVRLGIRLRFIPARIGMVLAARFLPVALPTALAAQFLRRPPLPVPATAEVAAVRAAEVVAEEAAAGKRCLTTNLSVTNSRIEQFACADRSTEQR